MVPLSAAPAAAATVVAAVLLLLLPHHASPACPPPGDPSLAATLTWDPVAKTCMPAVDGCVGADMTTLPDVSGSWASGPRPRPGLAAFLLFHTVRSQLLYLQSRLLGQGTLHLPLTAWLLVATTQPLALGFAATAGGIPCGVEG